MRRLNLDIPLNPKQVAMYNALNSGHYTSVLFYGASRSGKTFLILYWMIVQCIAYRANNLIVRNTFTSLQSGMILQTLPAVLNAIADITGIPPTRRSPYKESRSPNTTGKITCFGFTMTLIFSLHLSALRGTMIRGSTRFFRRSGDIFSWTRFRRWIISPLTFSKPVWRRR